MQTDFVDYDDLFLMSKPVALDFRETISDELTPPLLETVPIKFVSQIDV